VPSGANLIRVVLVEESRNLPLRLLGHSSRGRLEPHGPTGRNWDLTLPSLDGV